MKKEDSPNIIPNNERKLNVGQDNAFNLESGIYEYGEIILRSIKENQVLKDLIIKKREGVEK